jgi:hypothetical protein
MLIYKVYLHKITIIAGDWDKKRGGTGIEVPTSS